MLVVDDIHGVVLASIQCQWLQLGSDGDGWEGNKCRGCRACIQHLSIDSVRCSR